MTLGKEQRRAAAIGRLFTLGWPTAAEISDAVLHRAWPQLAASISVQPGNRCLLSFHPPRHHNRLGVYSSL